MFEIHTFVNFSVTAVQLSLKDRVRQNKNLCIPSFLLFGRLVETFRRIFFHRFDT